MTQVNADNEFECLEENIRPAILHLVGANEHVGDVERSVRTVKDGSRCHVHRLPFKRYPKIMVAGMLTHITKSLNQLPAENGIDMHLSPATLITGCAAPDYNSVIKLNFGDYVQAHEPNAVTNDQSPRTVGAIALYPRTDNSWYFMSLDTGKRIHWYSWTLLPMSTDVVNRVTELAKKQKQPIVSGNFKYSWGEGQDILTEDNSTSDNVSIISNMSGEENIAEEDMELNEWEPEYIGEEDLSTNRDFRTFGSFG